MACEALTAGSHEPEAVGIVTCNASRLERTSTASVATLGSGEEREDHVNPSSREQPHNKARTIAKTTVRTRALFGCVPRIF
jgi:hypothetical protein